MKLSEYSHKTHSQVQQQELWNHLPPPPELSWLRRRLMVVAQQQLELEWCQIPPSFVAQPLMLASNAQFREREKNRTQKQSERETEETLKLYMVDPLRSDWFLWC